MSLNLFPVRSAIGRAQINGQSFDVLMTPEFSRALSDLLVRVGGSDGMNSSDIEQIARAGAIMQAFDAQPSPPDSVQEGDMFSAADQLQALARKVDSLEREIAQMRSAGPAFDLHSLETLVNMQVAPGVVKGVATGSRGGNAALASLLTALAKCGLVTDSTTA